MPLVQNTQSDDSKLSCWVLNRVITHFSVDLMFKVVSTAAGILHTYKIVC